MPLYFMNTPRNRIRRKFVRQSVFELDNSVHFVHVVGFESKLLIVLIYESSDGRFSDQPTFSLDSLNQLEVY